MKNKTKVEIIQPFIDGQEKGDINYMNPDDAKRYHEYGAVKIIEETKKPTQKKETRQKKTPSSPPNLKLRLEVDPIKQIIERMKDKEDSFIQIFSGDDKKQQKKTYESYFNVNTDSIEVIKEKIKAYNDNDSYAVFFNYNPLNKKRRLNANITRLNYIFIDLDDGATEEHLNLILDNLNSKMIKPSYVSKSGHGYHILVPISLKPDNKDKVKGFLTYLRENVCNKVDVATHTNERLFRVPNSEHKKDDVHKRLVTLHSVIPTENNIATNSKLILEYQEVTKKGKSDSKYISNVKRDDIFFSKILSDRKNWNTYVSYLNKAKDRNNNFIKNLSFYLKTSPSDILLAEDFINKFEPSRMGAIDGWMKKADTDNMSCNYFELLKWSQENELDLFTDLLIEQTRSSFLDKYEIYYLEDEKSENNTLLYFPEKNYYVQKSLQEVINNIYRDCREKAVNLEEELNLYYLYEDWNEFSFKKQIGLIFDQLRRKLEKENRIRTVFNLNYEPTEDKFIYYDNKKYFNIYNKTTIWDYYKKENKYHFPYIKELLMNLCGKDEKNYDWFCKWLAHQLKHPTEKLPTAVILQGKQGSGKGTLKNLILDNIFGSNCQEINQTHLENSFNDYLLGKQIIIANEVMHNENRQTLPNVLKNLVTDEEITINIKFKKSVKGQNYTHWIFCTNSDNPIKIDEDDRRYSVFYSQKLRKGLGHDIRKNLDYELKQFVSYLKDIDVIFDDISEPIMTEAKQDIIDLNKDSFARFKEFCNQYTNLEECWKVLFDKLKTDLFQIRGEGIYILTDDFYLLYEKYCEVYKERGRFAKQNFSKKMSNESMKSCVKRFNKGTKKVYSLDLLSQVFFTELNVQKQ